MSCSSAVSVTVVSLQATANTINKKNHIILFILLLIRFFNTQYLHVKYKYSIGHDHRRASTPAVSHGRWNKNGKRRSFFHTLGDKVPSLDDLAFSNLESIFSRVEL